MVLILDSSALFAMEDLPEEDSLCPPGVVEELRRLKDGRLDLWGARLRVSACTKASEDRVTATAKKSGDRIPCGRNIRHKTDREMELPVPGVRQMVQGETG